MKQKSSIGRHNNTLAACTAMLACAAPLATYGASRAEPAVRVDNPYAEIDWGTVEYVDSLSHEHGTDPQLFWDMGFRHLPISNYYPSRPLYPLPAPFAREHPDALGAPNAEQHGTIDSGIHFNALGSLYTTGYGRTPRIRAGVSPIEYVFEGLTVFDPNNAPWRGVYRLDLDIEPVSAGATAPAEAWLTIRGATEIVHRTFAPVGDGVVREKRIAARKRGATYLKAESDRMHVRVEFDPATTRVSRFRLMQGTNRPWRDAFRAALDGTLQDDAGRPIEGLLFPDGGGITLNHPWTTTDKLIEMLDFDPRVLGIEVWNGRNLFGGIKPQDAASAPFRDRWDEILRTGRRCFGFFVKDHFHYARGRNVLLLPAAAGRTRLERERDALRAYRTGRFFGSLGAMAVDRSGKVTAPYDRSGFRFTRIAVRQGPRGVPIGVDVSVAGADRARRPHTQIRFVTDTGTAHVAQAESAGFNLSRLASGAPACRYVRIEAFAYPETHDGGRALTAQALAAMDIVQIARIHDWLGDISETKIDPPGQAPIATVDMLFSQPIRFRK